MTSILSTCSEVLSGRVLHGYVRWKSNDAMLTVTNGIFQQATCIVFDDVIQLSKDGKIVCRKRASPTSFMNFFRRVRYLLTKGWLPDKTKGGVTHDLHLYVKINEDGSESIVGTDLVSVFF